MAEEDIYSNKATYEKKVTDITAFLQKPKRGIYYCKNPKNLKYFRKLITYFEMKDLSYVRRMKVLHVITMVTYIVEKDLKECDRDDINQFVAFTHTRWKTPSSKRDVVKDLKVIWKVCFPEKDHLGRVDERLIPWPVRHLLWKVEKSKEKLRNERLTIEEFRKIVDHFAGDPKMQAYLTLAFESLGRPQEILYTRIKDYEFYDNFAKIWISEHGKEGTGFLQCIDSYPYVMEWFRQHPLRHDPQAFFFVNQNNNGLHKQWKNNTINKRLRKACQVLGLRKRVTCYSAKQNYLSEGLGTPTLMKNLGEQSEPFILC